MLAYVVFIALALSYVSGDSQIWPVKASTVLNYKNDTVGDLVREPCLPLTDVSGIDFPKASPPSRFALVASINGINVVDLTVRGSPRDRGFIRSCLSADRYIFSYHDSTFSNPTLYSVSNISPLCQCNDPKFNCSLQMKVNSGGKTYSLATSVVPLFSSDPSPPAPTFSSLPVLLPPILDGCAAYPVGGAGSVTDGLAVVRLGNCSFAQKAAMAQQGRAKALLIVNSREDIVFSRRTLAIDPVWRNFNLTIPVLFVANSNMTVLTTSATASLSPDSLAPSPLYSEPPGLTIVDLAPLATSSGQPRLVDHRLDWFKFSSRMHVISGGDPILYVVGTDTYNGGLVMLDISSPLNPRLISTWTETPLTDIIVATCGNYKLAFCVSPSTYQVVIIDVTSVFRPVTAMRFNTPFPPHSLSPNPSCNYLYVAYEGGNVPSDVYTIPTYVPPPIPEPSNNTNSTDPIPTPVFPSLNTTNSTNPTISSTYTFPLNMTDSIDFLFDSSSSESSPIRDTVLPRASYDVIIEPTVQAYYYPSNRSAVSLEIIAYNDFLYVADAGLSLFSINHPLSPSLLARTGSYASTSFSATAGLYARNAREVYLVDRDRGLLVLQYEQEQVVELVNVTTMSTGATIAAALLSVGFLTIFFIVFVIFRLEHWIR
eukprot:TRINITY_DN4055_c0_g1_i4.p1 TRINITY_DN4055_c0_g1~~TRINITY_DN4055_c0_g1_i4.p1  ORF type:complete len:654 (-),score=149.69 TRINITY_DN4055_c0_g1_i4:11-1972(-)